jgi:hypothetical protein
LETKRSGKDGSNDLNNGKRDATQIDKMMLALVWWPIMLTWALLAGGASTISSVWNAVHELSTKHAAALGLASSPVDWEMLDLYVKLARANSAADLAAAKHIKSLLGEVQQRRTDLLAKELCHLSSAMRRKLLKEKRKADATGPAALLALIDQAVDEQVCMCASLSLSLSWFIVKRLTQGWCNCAQDFKRAAKLHRRLIQLAPPPPPRPDLDRLIRDAEQQVAEAVEREAREQKDAIARLSARLDRLIAVP